MTDHAGEGGDPACWAHLVDDDGYGHVDLTDPLAVGSPTVAGLDSSDGQACGGEVALDAEAIIECPSSSTRNRVAVAASGTPNQPEELEDFEDRRLTDFGMWRSSVPNAAVSLRGA